MDGANWPRKLMRRSSRVARPLVWLTTTPPPPPPPDDGGGRRVSHDVPPERHRRLTNVLRRPVNSTISISENTGKMYNRGSVGCAKKIVICFDIPGRVVEWIQRVSLGSEFEPRSVSMNTALFFFYPDAKWLFEGRRSSDLVTLSKGAGLTKKLLNMQD